MRFLAVLAADHHVVTATGLGPRRGEHNRGNQHKSRCRDGTCQFPHELRDHEVLKPRKEPPNRENRNNEMKADNLLSRPTNSKMSRKKSEPPANREEMNLQNYNRKSKSPRLLYDGKHQIAGADHEFRVPDAEHHRPGITVPISMSGLR
jgi:hypothetical protein